MSACWICCHTVWLWCSYVTLICSLTLGTSLARQCYVASHQIINFSTNHLFTELSARVASENLLKTLYVTSFHFRTQTLGLSWLAVTQLSFWQLSSAPSSHTLHFRQSWAGAKLSWAPATLKSVWHVTLVEFTPTASSPPLGFSLHWLTPNNCHEHEWPIPTSSTLQYQSIQPTTSTQEYHTTNGQFRTSMETNNRYQCWHHHDGHSLSAMPSPWQHDTTLPIHRWVHPGTCMAGGMWQRDGHGTCHLRSATNHGDNCQVSLSTQLSVPFSLPISSSCQHPLIFSDISGMQSWHSNCYKPLLGNCLVTPMIQKVWDFLSEHGFCIGNCSTFMVVI